MMSLAAISGRLSYSDARVDAWHRSVDHELGGDPGVIGGLVLDELDHISVLAWLRDAGDKDPMSTFRGSTPALMRRMRSRLQRLWTAIDKLEFELAITDRSVSNQAIALMSNPGLSPETRFMQPMRSTHAAGSSSARTPTTTA
jgi:hypothetical protein